MSLCLQIGPQIARGLVCLAGTHTRLGDKCPGLRFSCVPKSHRLLHELSQKSADSVIIPIWQRGELRPFTEWFRSGSRGHAARVWESWDLSTDLSDARVFPHSDGTCLDQSPPVWASVSLQWTKEIDLGNLKADYKAEMDLHSEDLLLRPRIHSQVVQPWASCSTPPSLSFCIYEMGAKPFTRDQIQ